MKCALHTSGPDVSDIEAVKPETSGYRIGYDSLSRRIVGFSVNNRPMRYRTKPGASGTEDTK
jgi:hypothetical protein